MTHPGFPINVSRGSRCELRYINRVSESFAPVTADSNRNDAVVRITAK
jgi:hypothetical protein